MPRQRLISPSCRHVLSAKSAQGMFRTRGSPKRETSWFSSRVSRRLRLWEIQHCDMGIWPHIRGYSITGFSEEDRASFPSLLKWIDRIAQREAVKIAVSSKYDSEKNPALVVRTA